MLPEKVLFPNSEPRLVIVWSAVLGADSACIEYLFAYCEMGKAKKWNSDLIPKYKS